MLYSKDYLRDGKFGISATTQRQLMSHNNHTVIYKCKGSVRGAVIVNRSYIAASYSVILYI